LCRRRNEIFANIFLLMFQSSNHDFCIAINLWISLNSNFLIVFCYLFLDRVVFDFVFFFEDEKKFATRYIVSEYIEHQSCLSVISFITMCLNSYDFDSLEVVAVTLKKFICNESLIHVFNIRNSIFIIFV
jgi:hypothetical protein